MFFHYQEDYCQMFNMKGVPIVTGKFDSIKENNALFKQLADAGNRPRWSSTVDCQGNSEQ